MSSEQNHNSEAVAQLQEGLRTFESLGCGRPTAASLREYLSLLVNARIITEEIADQVVLAFNVYRYGGTAEVDPLPPALAGLQSAAEKLRALDPEKREQISRLLRERFSSPETPPAPSRASRSSATPDSPMIVPSNPEPFPPPPTRLASVDDPFAPSPEQDLSATSATTSSWLRRRWGILVVLGVLLWTFAVVIASYLRHDDLRKIVVDARDRFAAGETEERPRSRPNWNVRETPPAPIPEIEMLMNRAHAFERNHQMDLTMKAYEVVLAIDPNHPEANNNLAWALLTGENLSLRDPERALPIAKLAVELDPNFAYLDTLAEAWFQNGDPAKAVEVEEQAIAKAEGFQFNRANLQLEFLRKQLERFQQGLNALSETGSSDTSSTAVPSTDSLSDSSNTSGTNLNLSLPPEPTSPPEKHSTAGGPEPPPLPE